MAAFLEESTTTVANAIQDDARATGNAALRYAGPFPLAAAATFFPGPGLCRFKIKLTTILPKLTIQPTMLIVGAMVAANGSTYGQGTVLFDTKAVGTGALVYDAAGFGGAPLGSAYVGDGTNFFAQLYAAAGTGAATSSLVAVGVPVNFRGGVSAGWLQTSGTTSLGFALTPSPPGPGAVVTIPFLTLGGPSVANTPPFREPLRLKFRR